MGSIYKSDAFPHGDETPSNHVYVSAAVLSFEEREIQREKTLMLGKPRGYFRVKDLPSGDYEIHAGSGSFLYNADCYCQCCWFVYDLPAM